VVNSDLWSVGWAGALNTDLGISIGINPALGPGKMVFIET